MRSELRPDVPFDRLDQWCQGTLGTGASRISFEAGYSSAVYGVDLVDGQRVVVKVRPWQERLVACSAVHRHLFASGFTCPELLYGPIEIDELGVTVEQFVAGEPRGGGDAAADLATVLAELIDRAPAPRDVAPLRPQYAFQQWPTNPTREFWPATPEIGRDLNDAVYALPWVDDLARQVANRLAFKAPVVIGHGDWWSNNIRWSGGTLAAVDDWDSVVALPEPALVGIAAAVFNDGESTVQQSDAFIEAYARATSRLTDSASREVAWAAGLWARLVDAKKSHALGYNGNVDTLQSQAAERASRAGVGA